MKSSTPSATGLADLQTLLRSWTIMIDEALDTYLVRPEVEPQVMHRAMRDAVLAGGQRRRPLLTMLAAHACGGQVQHVLPAACAFELIHASSLILDDLPCMDDAELRRGRPTCHVIYGEAVATLASVALLALANALILRNGDHPGVSAHATRQVLHDALALTGSQGMIAGQMGDLQATAGDGDPVDLSDMHHHKSGLLYVSAARAGALLSDAPAHEVAALAQYAADLGCAYQIMDDVGDVEGTPEALGKATGMDQDKVTFATRYGTPTAKRFAQDYLHSALEALETFGARAQYLRTFALEMIPLTPARPYTAMVATPATS